MKTAITVLVALLASPSYAAVMFYDSQAAFDSVATTTLLDDFDGFGQPDKNIFGSITRGSLTYTPLAPSTNLVISGASSVYNNFGTNLNPFTGTVLTVSGPEKIRVTYQTAVSALGFDGYLNGLGPGTVEVYDGTNLLSTFNLPNPTGGAKIFVGVTSTVPISSFVWTTTDGGIRNSAIDTILGGSVNAVSEPSTLALLTACLIGLCSVRRVTPRTPRIQGHPL